jgi:hypothetical protein
MNRTLLHPMEESPSTSCEILPNETVDTDGNGLAVFLGYQIKTGLIVAPECIP